MFFFSSRRRHTRFDCDWSSDVCSSDLDKAQDQKRLRELNREAEEILDAAPESSEGEVNSEVLDISSTDSPEGSPNRPSEESPDTLGRVLMKDIRPGRAGFSGPRPPNLAEAKHGIKDFELEKFGESVPMSEPSSA